LARTWAGQHPGQLQRPQGLVQGTGRPGESARDIQDGILRTRLDVSRVPEWLYRHYRSRDVVDFADTAEGHRRRLAG
jgi:hypothetical protein